MRQVTKQQQRLPSAGGPERLVLGLALLLPLAVILMALGQLPGTSFASPASLLRNDARENVAPKRPVASESAPPPTLVPPTPTAKPAATPVPPTPVPAARTNSYTVQPGDELKHIAADYNVSIWKLISVNDIPNPDSLRVGQVLRIPQN